MTKHLAIKVNNKYESEAVQKALFDMGFVWWDSKKAEIKHPVEIHESFGIPRIYVKRFLIPYTNEKKITEMTEFSYNSWYFVNPELLNRFEEVSYCEFFDNYAGHIERFPDYVLTPNKETQEAMEEARKGDLEEFKTPEDMMKSLRKDTPICKQCGNEFHYCNSCGFYEYRYLGYCSEECMEKTKPQEAESGLPEPAKFKVGDWLWKVTKGAIESAQIEGIRYFSNSCEYITSDVCHIIEPLIDMNTKLFNTEIIYKFWCSTPELAAKRFLELQK